MTQYTAVLDGSKTNVEGHSKFLNRLFGPGVATTFNAASLQVVQRSAGANMSVDVSIGDAHLQLPNTNYSFWSWTDAVTNVTISAADPTNPRIDTIIAWVDTSVTTTASNNSPGSFKFTAIAGTPAGTPAAATNSAIQTALGSTIAWVKLATVLVGASATTITTSVITDARSAITNIANIDTSTLNTDWRTASTTVSSVTANGQGSYSMAVSSNLTGVLSPGMRIRTTRNLLAPILCSTFNGTTQYLTKASPAGTWPSTAFTCVAKIKPSAYPSGIQGGGVIGRTDGSTAGLQLRIKPEGTVSVYYASGSNFTEWATLQSIPLNKWSHIAAVVSSVSSKTLQGIYIDGSPVPTTVVGTQNATSVTYTGNLSIGAIGAGLANSFYQGNVSQAAVFSSALTQATILNYSNQTLSGSESTLISGYGLSNSLNDLNVTNANNLSAINSPVTNTADAPWGGQADGTISSVYDYCILESITPSILNVQAAEGCTIPTIGGISALSYSSADRPYGFPSETTKWSIETLIRVQENIGITGTSSWSSGGSSVNCLTIPSGKWNYGFEGTIWESSTVSSSRNFFWALASSVPTTVPAQNVPGGRILGTSSDAMATVYTRRSVALAAPTTFRGYGYLVVASGSEFWKFDAGEIECRMFAENAYL